LAGAARAEGRIAITGGELRIPDNLPASVPVLTGVREVGRAPPGRPPRARPAPPRSGAAGAPPARSAAPPLVAGSGGIALAIAVEVPGRLWLRGRGLEAELGGRLNIGGTTASPVVTGALETRQGRLELAGRRLELARGAVRFDRGELIPSIDVQATSRTTTHTLTIGLVGAATQPEVQLSATPELPRDEVLARLLFDRPSSALSPLEIAQSASALAQLAGLAAPGSGAINRLRALLGLDRLGVGSAGANDPSRTGAAVEAGRYVAPGVFVGVQQGTDGRTSVGVQVELLPRLRLEGSNGTGPAGQRLGLTYEYEY
jgi:translocation and assembly module TamB